MYSAFDWPIPPSYELVPGDDFSGPEPALLVLARGQKIQGSLTRFLPTHGIVEFLPSRGRINLDVPLADVVQLRLTRAVLVRARSIALEDQAAKSAPEPQKQPYRVELVNGEILEGVTLGFIVHSTGLLVFTE